MIDHRSELQEQFSDAAIALMMHEYAQDSGEDLLHKFQDSGEIIPPELDQRCQKAIQKAHKRTLMGSTLQRAARAAACGVILLVLLFPLAMSVEAFRIPTLNFILKYGKGFTGITFSQDSGSFTALDNLRLLLWPTIPEGYEFEAEHVNTVNPRGVEQISSFLIRYQNEDGGKLDIAITKAEGAINVDSQDAQVISMELSGQQAVFIAGEALRILWVNEDQGQLYNVVGYNTGPDDFWKCVYALSEATRTAGTQIRF